MNIETVKGIVAVLKAAASSVHDNISDCGSTVRENVADLEIFHHFAEQVLECTTPDEVKEVYKRAYFDVPDEEEEATFEASFEEMWKDILDVPSV